jgi:hypothetical protein
MVSLRLRLRSRGEATLAVPASQALDRTSRAPLGVDGILNPGAIDDITSDDDGFVTLHLVQTCDWDCSDQLLLLLQEKLFNYLAYIADGELARWHPGQQSRWRVAIDCASEPDARTLTLLRQAADQFTTLGGSLEVRRPKPVDQ